MTQTAGHPTLDHAAVVEALTVAVRAPSIHNTQPWSWHLVDGVLALRADRTRQLAVADPDGHSLLISCGAALALTEVGLRAAGWSVAVDRLPDARDPDLLATFRGVERRRPDQVDTQRVAAALHRRSERRPFADAPVSPEQIEALRHAAEGPGVFAHFPTRSGEQLDLAIAVSQADRYERRDADYLAEMARWTYAEGVRFEGVPATSVPHATDDEPRHSNIPVRDFEVGVPGAQLIEAGVDEQPLIAVLFTTADGPADQLAAGESMMRVMLEAELLDLASCPLSQAVDMLAFRTRLRTLMSWTEYPQMMLRIGHWPAEPPAPLAPRRPVDAVLHARDGEE